MEFNSYIYCSYKLDLTKASFHTHTTARHTLHHHMIAVYIQAGVNAQAAFAVASF